MKLIAACSFKTIPQGLKLRSFRGVYGTAEAVPFQNICHADGTLRRAQSRIEAAPFQNSIFTTGSWAEGLA